MSSKSPVEAGTERFHYLVETGILTEAQLCEVETGAVYRGVDMERILRHEYHVPRRKILDALSRYYECPWVEYDERRPIPFELLLRLDAEAVCVDQWFPIIRDGQTAIIAASNPRDPDLPEKVKACVRADKYEFYVALPEDIQSYVEDYLNSDPKHLIGNERTSLALWRNTMARWRTRLACYRTDFAKVRTNLGFLRGGLGLIAIARTLMLLHETTPFYHLYWIMIGIGLFLIAMGIYHYIRIKRNVLRPPPHHTLVEVTTAVMYFLENFQFVEKETKKISSRKTMLARLAESLLEYTIVIDQSHDNKKRSYLAHERNLLSAQRTVAACYRTIYARARTGLAFIRTGVSFLAIGVGIMEYFGLSLLTFFDLLFVLASLWMIVDGASWYIPVWREQSEVPDYLVASFSEEL